MSDNLLERLRAASAYYGVAEDAAKEIERLTALCDKGAVAALREANDRAEQAERERVKLEEQLAIIWFAGTQKDDGAEWTAADVLLNRMRAKLEQAEVRAEKLAEIAIQDNEVVLERMVTISRLRRERDKAVERADGMSESYCELQATLADTRAKLERAKAKLRRVGEAACGQAPGPGDVESRMSRVRAELAEEDV